MLVGSSFHFPLLVLSVWSLLAMLGHFAFHPRGALFTAPVVQVGTGRQQLGGMGACSWLVCIRRGSRLVHASHLQRREENDGHDLVVQLPAAVPSHFPDDEFFLRKILEH